MCEHIAASHSKAGKTFVSLPSLMLSSKVDFVPFCHSVLDTESSEFSHLWIPAFAGMTVFGLLTSSSSLDL